MNERKLSQDDIDALLKAGEEDEETWPTYEQDGEPEVAVTTAETKHTTASKTAAEEGARAANVQNEEEKHTQYIGDNINQKDASIQQATFSELEQISLNQSEKRNLDMLMDIPLKVSVELGHAKQTIKNILELSAGSVIELDKLAGEPVDILVNEKLVAKGEVVVIEESFGVRVMDIISQSDRLMKLK